MGRIILEAGRKMSRARREAKYEKRLGG